MKCFSFFRILIFCALAANTVACGPIKEKTPADGRLALIYSGAGANPSGVASIGEILRERGLIVATADHNAFNSMSVADLAKHSIIIFPGGNADQMNAAFTEAARLRMKKAIILHGVSYTGFCAGAWMAVGPAQSVSATPYWGFGFVKGDYLKQYYPNGEDPQSAVIEAKFATGETRQIIWWQGPVLPEISDGVFARYPDGSPAFVGTWAGKGYVTLTGLHPEAPRSWSIGLTDSDGLDYEIAWRTIQSALDKTALVAY